MTIDEAVKSADNFNQTGRYRDTHFYFVAYHSTEEQFFVMRRSRDVYVRVVQFIDGKLSILEQNQDAS